MIKNSILIAALFLMACNSNGANPTAQTNDDLKNAGATSSSIAMQTLDEDSDENTKGQPPAVVIDAFKTKFPSAEKVKWGMEDKTEWEAEFVLNGVDESSNFSADGKWLETETEITLSSFPKEVTDAIAKNYPGWKITETDKTETAAYGLIYEADIQYGNKKTEVAFKPDGTEIHE